MSRRPAASTAVRSVATGRSVAGSRSVVLGSAPDARYGVARIPADRISRHLRCEGHAGMPEVGPLTPDAIRTPERIDTYVRLDGLRFTESAAWCDLDRARRRGPAPARRTAR